MACPVAEKSVPLRRLTESKHVSTNIGGHMSERNFSSYTAADFVNGSGFEAIHKLKRQTERQEGRIRRLEKRLRAVAARRWLRPSSWLGFALRGAVDA